jgi:hypothetical protein
VTASLAEGRALRVAQTPTMFINGRQVAGGMSWDQLKTYIDWELEHAKKEAKEAEACCSISLPVPGKK